jgi:hypothetical protein
MIYITPKKETTLNQIEEGKKRPNTLPRSLKPTSERDKAIISQMWKADHHARTLHHRTGLSIDEIG